MDIIHPLKTNMRGQDVQALQDALRQLGFDHQGQAGIYDSKTFLAVESFQKTVGLKLTGLVDLATATAISQRLKALPISQYIIRGSVVNSDGSALGSGIVVAFEKRLRSEKAIGRDFLSRGEKGFEIAYNTPAEFPFSVIVRVFSDRSEENEIATSELICDVKPVENINLIVGGKPLLTLWEYQQLHDAIAPILSQENIAAADLNNDDIEFITCKYKINSEHLALYNVSSRHHQRTDILAEIFYGLLRQGLPRELPALVTQPLDILEHALSDSVAQHIINPRFGDQIPKVLEQIQDQVIQLAQNKNDPDKPSFEALFDVAGVNVLQRSRILGAYVKRKGSVEEFWQELKNDVDIRDEELDELQKILKISSITLNHLKLVNQVVMMQRKGDLGNQLSDLCQLKVEDWLELINKQVGNHKIGAPAFFGTEEDQRHLRYAKFLPRMMESLFPTTVLSHRLADFEEPDFNVSAVTAFLQANPEFEFRNTSVTAYLDNHPEALAGIDNPDDTISRLKTVQRLFDVAPATNKAQAIAVLMKKEIASATAIRRMGATQFIRLNTDDLGADVAQTIYTRAARKADTALHIFSQSQAFNSANPKVIPVRPFGQIAPDLDDVFGSLDFCACEHCQSVYSPAAYLVAILHFLMNRSGDVEDRTALDVLFDRRPDLGEIALTCKNTNTTMPHIDLVLEILETAVVNNGMLSVESESGIDDHFPYQTTEDAQTLSISPQHVNDDAYKILSDAVYPWQLPFDLRYSEIRMYLEHLGMPLYDIIRYFRFSQRTDIQSAYASEFLGLTPKDRTIVINASNDTVFSLWGFSNASLFNDFVLQGNLGDILERSELTYDELVLLIKVPYIRGTQQLEIQFEAGSCDPNKATIESLDESVLERLRRFVVLWNKATWSIEELASALDATLGFTDANEIDSDVLVQLSAIADLQHTLNVPLETLLSWLNEPLATMTWHDDKPSYYKVFLGTSIGKSHANIFQLNEQNTELVDTTATLIEHKEVLCQLLRVSSDDLQQLITAELSDDTFNLHNLSRLYRIISFIQLQKLSIQDYLALLGLLGGSIFGDMTATALVDIVDLLQRINDSPFTIAELDYLLRHKLSENLDIVPDSDYVAGFLEELQKNLQNIDDNFSIPEEDRKILSTIEEALSRFLTLDEVNQVLGIVYGTSVQTLESKVNLIESAFPLLANASNLVSAWHEEVEGDKTPAAEKARAFLNAAIPALRQSEKERTTVQLFSLALGLDQSTVELLLGRQVSMSESNVSFLSIFSQIDSDEDVEISKQTSYDWLYKITFLINKLSFTNDEIQFYFLSGITAGWPDLEQLPLAPLEHSPLELSSFLDIVQLFGVASNLTGEQEGLVDLLTLLDKDLPRDEYLKVVSQSTQWDLDDVMFLTGPQALNITYPDGFRDGLFLSKTVPRIHILNILNVPAEEVSVWAQSINSDQVLHTANAVKQMVRQKYVDEDQWLHVAKPLHDHLREEQRNALVTYLSHLLEVDNSRTLYTHFLIDVEMSACMSTSRIAQAISSVQLFISRCLLNLETVQLSSKDIEEWQWMKSYRTWEAALKVLIHPENWLHISSREDKTSLFQQLENGLMQGEVTEDLAQHAYKEYLVGLDNISKLKICATCRQWEQYQDILHVFGRTRNAPHVYYYRRWVDQRYWTPWESIELAVEGQQLIPVFWEDTLYLFWPTFIEKADAPKISEDITPLPDPIRYHEVKMSWSVYDGNTWSTPQVSDDFITTPKSSVSRKLAEISFWPQFDAKGRLYIVNDFGTEQFRFNEKRGELIANRQKTIHGQVIEVPFRSLPLQQRSPLPNTKNRYGNLKETDESNGRLIIHSVDDDPVLGDPQADVVLKSTPGKFNLIIPSTERLARSRSPFFFSDPKRTFLVLPRGSYIGGFSAPEIDDLTIGFSPVVPLDQSDAVTRTIAAHTMRGLNLNDLQNTNFSTHNNNFITTDAQSILLNQQMTLIGPARWQAKTYRFENHYHPFSSLLLRQFERYGVDGVLKPDGEKEPQRKSLLSTLRRQNTRRAFFQKEYGPSLDVVENVKGISSLLELALAEPLERFDFSYGGAYSTYNWEVFYHIPYTLGRQLSRNQQFADAQRWFHYIFDPTCTLDGNSNDPWPERVWQIHPFFEHSTGKLAEDMKLLSRSSALNRQQKASRQQLLDQIEQWRKNPYSPHALGRIRIEAYMKAVVMSYLDNLIAWGDSLLRNDTRESINQATHIYSLAAELLGDRPREISPPNRDVTADSERAKTFNDLSSDLDQFSNALVLLEEQIAADQTPDTGSVSSDLLPMTDFSIADVNIENDSKRDSFVAVSPVEPPEGNSFTLDLPLAKPIPRSLVSLFFCIPKNDKLLGYWDIVDDRLFKIRHCMNIDGVIRHLPLFQPPIDPELLIRASASGANIDNVLSDIAMPLPYYRFRIIVAKATELTNEVKSLGAALLSAMEKKDSEALSLLRSEQELRMLKLTKEVLRKRLEEENAQKKSLLASRRSIAHRYKHYESLLLKEEESLQSIAVGEEISLRTPSSNLVMFDTLPQNIDIENEIPGHDLNNIVSNIKDLAGGLIGKTRSFISSVNPLKALANKSRIIRRLRKAGRKVKGKIRGGISFIKDKVFKNVNAPIFSSVFDEDTLQVPDSVKLNSSLQLLGQEKSAIKSLAGAQRSAEGAGNQQKLAALWQALPMSEISAKPLGIGAAVTVMGKMFSARTSALAIAYQNESGRYGFNASLEDKIGNFILRENEWTLQSNLAAMDIMQIDKQLAIADIRISIAKKEIRNHEKRIKNAVDVDNFMNEKFTNVELYSWMVEQLSDLYSKTYQLSTDFAKTAERAYQYELGIDKTHFIKSRVWNNLKQGLLAGEALHHDLKQMEVSYLEGNKREFELTKHISLHQLNSMALLKLKVEGQCDIEFPEYIFDLDCPGHYFRRIKSVSLSIPAITGPYTSISCSVNLLKSSIRKESTLLGGQYSRDLENDDSRFSDTYGAVQSIATSSAQNDSGLFELNFRDDRYLPFEGHGVISQWQLNMPHDLRQFDYNTITDVVIHIRYTARQGGQVLGNASTSFIKNELLPAANSNGLSQLFNLKQDFPMQWHQAFNGDDNLRLPIKKEHFPYMAQVFNLEVHGIEIYSSDGETLTPLAGDSLISPPHPNPTDVLIIDEDASSPTELVIDLSSIGSDEHIFVLMKYQLLE